MAAELKLSALDGVVMRIDAGKLTQFMREVRSALDQCHVRHYDLLQFIDIFEISLASQYTEYLKKEKERMRTALVEAQRGPVTAPMRSPSEALMQIQSSGKKRPRPNKGGDGDGNGDSSDRKRKRRKQSADA